MTTNMTTMTTAITLSGKEHTVDPVAQVNSIVAIVNLLIT